MLDCGMSCIKYVIFIFNFLFALSGIGLIVVGASVLHDVDRFRAFLQESFLVPPVLFIIVGIIVFIIAFLGCCGAIRESPCMLALFAGIIFVLFVAQLSVGIFASTNKSAFNEQLHQAMKASKDNYSEIIPQERKRWDDIQSILKCCGVDGPDDWKMGGYYPASCCAGFSSPLHGDHLCKMREFVFEEGCFGKLRGRLIEESHVILGVAVGIAVLELAGMILACVLASEIAAERKNESRH